MCPKMRDELKKSCLTCIFHTPMQPTINGIEDEACNYRPTE